MSEVALVGQGHRAGRHAEECAEIEVREQARKLVPRSGWMRSVGTFAGWDVRRYRIFLKSSNCQFSLVRRACWEFEAIGGC